MEASTAPAPAASRPARTPLAERSLPRHLAIAVVAGALLFVISLVLDPFANFQLANIGYTFIAVAGLTLLTGANGQISLGHGALMAVGAYTAVKVGEGRELPLVVPLIAAVVATSLVGVLAGAAAARLRGPYLAGATLALAVGLPAVALRFSDELGGENGLTATQPTPPDALGEIFPPERWHFWVTALCALLVYLLLANLSRSRQGRLFRAVRGDEVAAELSGLNVARIKVLAFVVSAACAGLAGGLLVIVNGLAAPGAFTLTLSIGLLTGVILGGLGSLMGAVWGAALVVLLPILAEDLGQALSLPGRVEANLPLGVYGLALILVMLFAPQGLQGAVRRVGALVRPGRRESSATAGGTAAAKEE